jgi:salicylate hydroxylase
LQRRSNGAALVIGADGLRSTIRACLFGDEPARFTGYVVWRAIVPAEAVPERFARKITTWLGVGRHSMLYPVRADAFNLSGFMPAAEVHGESWTNPVDITDLRRVFADTSPEFTGLFDSIASALITPLYFRDPLERWSSGRVVLLGDAAHPMPPSAGQGAAMALEDAVTLAACLRRDGDTAAAFSEYHERRRVRTSRMLVASRINLALFNESDPVRMHARNSRLRALQRLDPAGDSTVGWQYGHDAVAEAAAPTGTVIATNPLIRPPARRAFDAWRAALTLEDHAGLWPGQRAGYERFLLTQDGSSRFATAEADCDGVAALRVSAGGDLALAWIHRRAA